MDHIVQQIQALSTNNDSDLKKLKDFLRTEHETFKTQAGAIAQALTSLDRIQHTLGVAFLLAAQLTHVASLRSADLAEDRQTFAYVSAFLRTADEQQVKKASLQFMTVCKCYAQMAIDLGDQAMLRSLVPLRCALETLRPNTETWTPVHTDFLRVCLKCKAYHLGAAVLDTPVYDMPASSSSNCTHMTAQNFLNFFYYAAMLRIGMNQYAQASQLLLVVLTWPASCLCETQGDAYKKYVLVSLKLHGEVKPLPVYTSQVALKMSQEPGYDKELVQAFKQGDAAALQAVLETNAVAIEEDENSGLVQKVLASLKRHKLQMLTQTYLTTSLAEIAEDIGLGPGGAADAEALLFDMISAGEINARIEQTTGHVAFEEEPADAEMAMVGKMSGRLQQILGLAQRIAAFEQEVVSSEAYIKKTTTMAGLASIGAPTIGEYDFMDM